MSTTTIKPRKKRKFTVKNLFAHLPRGWHNAPLCLTNSMGYPYFVQRIELHENADGRRVICLYREQVDPQAHS